jgi:hypothetical protein
MTDGHSAATVVYRYLSGRPLDGQARTDGGYFRRGRPVGGWASPWARLPGWQRQAVRIGGPALFVAENLALHAAPATTLAGNGAVALTAGVYGGRAARRAWQTRRFRSVYIRPVLAALKQTLGEAPVRLHVDPGLGNLMPRLARPMSPAELAMRTWYGTRLEPAVRWLPDRAMRGVWATQTGLRPVTNRLELLRAPQEEDAGPRIELRCSVPFLTAEQRQFVSAVVGAKIPAGELVEAWDQVGTAVTATWTVRRRPPSRVGYADLGARIKQLKEWEFFLGLGVGGKPVTISLKDDSPHIACSAASGGGKSVLAQVIAVQVLARGGKVVILDLKGSHRWALGMPGVDYCTRPEQMHDALIRIAALSDQRNQDALHEDEGWDPGPRHLVIAEELNATMTQLRDHWADVREKGQPKTSPAVKAFRYLLFMGRSAKVNVFAVAQMLTANTTGGPESRENFGIRCLARYTTNNWKMLVPEAAMPRASRTQGRWQIVVGGTATECQVCYLSPAEARLFVHKLSPSAGTPLMAGDQEMSPGQSPSGDKFGASESAPARPRVTLRSAVDHGLVPWRHAAAKKRLQRARTKGKESVPAPAGQDGLADLYHVDELIQWVESELVSS